MEKSSVPSKQETQEFKAKFGYLRDSLKKERQWKEKYRKRLDKDTCFLDKQPHSQQAFENGMPNHQPMFTAKLF